MGLEGGQPKEFLMEANDMLCYSNSAKMQPSIGVNVDKHERTFVPFRP